MSAVCMWVLFLGACSHTSKVEQEQQLSEMMDGAGGMRLELIHHFIMNGNYDAAIPMVRMALKQDPNNASAYYYHGLILIEKNQYELAQQALLRSLELQPDLSQAMDRLGVLHGRLGSMGEAVSWHEAAIKVQGDNPVYHNNLGYTLFAAGEPGKSVVAYQRAVDLDPSNTVTYNNLGFVYGRLEQYNRARQAFEQAGSPLTAEMNMGLVYRLMGRWGDAAACYRSALLLSPGNEEIQASLGEVVAIMDGGQGQDGEPVLEKDWPLNGGGAGMVPLSHGANGDGAGGGGGVRGVEEVEAELQAQDHTQVEIEVVNVGSKGANDVDKVGAPIVVGRPSAMTEFLPQDGVGMVQNRESK